MAKSEFGIRLKELFDNAVNAVIAEKLDVSEDAVGTYVRGRVPPAEKLSEIYRLTNCNLHWLLTGKGEKHFRPSERESNGVIERVRIVAEEQSRRMHADAEIDGGGGERATLKLLTDYLLATGMAEFQLIASVADVMSAADIARARKFALARMSIDQRIKQMVRDEIGESEGASERVRDGVTENADESIIATGKVVARIEPGRRIEGESGRVSDGETRRKRRTG